MGTDRTVNRELVAWRLYDLGLEIKDVAERLGISRQVVGRVVNGKHNGAIDDLERVIVTGLRLRLDLAAPLTRSPEAIAADLPAAVVEQVCRNNGVEPIA